MSSSWLIASSLSRAVPAVVALGRAASALRAPSLARGRSRRLVARHRPREDDVAASAAWRGRLLALQALPAPPLLGRAERLTGR
eukprot:11236127-Prorocentrum_lima.AAC.1